MKDPAEYELEIRAWMSRYTADPDVFELLWCCAGRVLMKNRTVHFQQSEMWMELLVWWLARSVERKAPWLDSLDALGRPKKLMKFSVFPDIVKEAQKAKAIDEQRCARIVLSEGEERLYDTLDDGLHLVEPLTPAALDREGGILQNCLGDGSFDGSLQTGDWQCLVLRDAANKTHAAIQINLASGYVWQVRGKQNRTPVRKYFAPLARYMASKKWSLMHQWGDGWLIDRDGTIHDVARLPSRIEVLGNLEIRDQKGVALPEHLSVSGFLQIARCELLYSCRSLKTGGNLKIDDTVMVKIADDVEVGRHMAVKGSKINYLADRLVVGGSLDILENLHLTRMPRTLEVADWMDARNTRFEEFGANTSVLGPLMISGAWAAGTFAFDADRNMLKEGDFVVIGKLADSATRKLSHLEGSLACVEYIFGQDGCGLMVADETVGDILYTVAVSSGLRKLLPPKHGYSNKGVYTVLSNGDVEVDYFSCACEEEPYDPFGGRTPIDREFRRIDRFSDGTSSPRQDRPGSDTGQASRQEPIEAEAEDADQFDDFDFWQPHAP